MVRHAQQIDHDRHNDKAAAGAEYRYDQYRQNPEVLHDVNATPCVDSPPFGDGQPYCLVPTGPYLFNANLAQYNVSREISSVFAETLLPITDDLELNEKARGLIAKAPDGYLGTAGDRRWEAAQVVVASGAYQRHRVPAFAAELDQGIVQLDTGRYRNPSQLRQGGVLVVGAGNSGAEIAYEVSGAHPTWLSGPEHGHIPVRTGSRWDRLLTPPFWWFVSHVLTVDTAVGRKVNNRPAAPVLRLRTT